MLFTMVGVLCLICNTNQLNPSDLRTTEWRGENNCCHSNAIFSSRLPLFVAEHVDSDEAKNLFEANYSHVYYILYDTFVQAEANLKQRGKCAFMVQRVVAKPIPVRPSQQQQHQQHTHGLCFSIFGALNISI